MPGPSPRGDIERDRAWPASGTPPRYCCCGRCAARLPSATIGHDPRRLGDLHEGHSGAPPSVDHRGRAERTRPDARASRIEGQRLEVSFNPLQQGLSSGSQVRGDCVIDFAAQLWPVEHRQVPPPLEKLLCAQGWTPQLPQLRHRLAGTGDDDLLPGGNAVEDVAPLLRSSRAETSGVRAGIAPCEPPRAASGQGEPPGSSSRCRGLGRSRAGRLDEGRRPGVWCLSWIRRTPSHGVRWILTSLQRRPSGQPPHESQIYTSSGPPPLTCLITVRRPTRSVTGKP